MLVPFGKATGSCFLTKLFSISINVPFSSTGLFVLSSTWATAAMEASASPRKPMVRMRKRSSIFRILEVACRSKAMRASVTLIPLPLSITCTSDFPASWIISFTCWPRHLWRFPSALSLHLPAAGSLHPQRFGLQYYPVSNSIRSFIFKARWVGNLVEIYFIFLRRFTGG